MIQIVRPVSIFDNKALDELWEAFKVSFCSKIDSSTDLLRQMIMHDSLNCNTSM